MNVQEEIRRLAYDFYEKSGRIGGMELEHWLRAEQIVMVRLSAQGKLEATGLETGKAHKTPLAGGSTKPRESHPASLGKVATAPKPQKTLKTKATAGGSVKPKKTVKKKSEPKSGGKTRKTKG